MLNRDFFEQSAPNCLAEYLPDQAGAALALVEDDLGVRRRGLRQFVACE